MMNVRRLAVALLLIAPAAAQEVGTIDRLIADLGSEEIDIRTAADAALKKGDRTTLAAVERALESTRNAEVLGRLQEIRGYLKVPHAGGGIVDGLRFQLLAEKTEVRPGEALAFKVVVWNLTGRARELNVGHSTCGEYFSYGSSIEILAPGEESGAEPRHHFLFCGTGARPLFKTVPAHGSQTFAVNAGFAGESRSPDALRPNAHYAFRNRWLSIDAPKGEVHRFRVRHRANLEGIDPKPEHWRGTAWSNEIEVKVLPAKY